MSDKYSEFYKLRVSDYTRYDTLSIHAILDILQDIAGKHCINYHMAYDDLIKNNQIWVLLKIKYEVVKNIGLYETLKATTWPKANKLVDFDRDFLLCDKNDDVVIKATSQWVIIDNNTRKIIPAKKVNNNLIAVNEDVFAEKLNKLADFTIDNCNVYKEEAQFMDLDHNGHVNNIKYGVYILNALSLKSDEKIKAFEINYINELHYKETISVYYKKENNTYNIKGIVDDKLIFIAKLDI